MFFFLAELEEDYLFLQELERPKSSSNCETVQYDHGVPGTSWKGGAA